MPEFTIHEVQNVTELRHFRYKVTADTKEEALEKVMSGECSPPENLGRIGDTDYGDNGWGHTQEEALADWKANDPLFSALAGEGDPTVPDPDPADDRDQT